MGTANLVRKRETESVRIVERLYPARFHMPMHGHGPAHISMVLAGGFEERIGRSAFDVQSPNVVFRAPASEHEVRFAPVSTRVLSVELKKALTQSATNAGIRMRESADLTSSKSSWIVSRLMEEFQKSDPVSRLAIDGLVIELLVELGRLRKHSPETGHLTRVIERLHAGLSAPPSLQELSDLAGMHPVSLSRAFHREFGCTISNYLRRLRMERATQLLARGEMSLAEIARELGFSDQAHFSRTFKAVTGFPPGLSRRAYRAG